MARALQKHVEGRLCDAYFKFIIRTADSPTIYRCKHDIDYWPMLGSALRLHETSLLGWLYDA